MKAVVLEKTGGPDVLRLKDVDDKKPGRGEVLIRVKAAGVNRIDIWIRSGKYPVTLPRIIGVDASGVVERVGEDVKNLAEGDRVVVDPVFYDDVCRYCTRGQTSLCENTKLLGFQVDGSYAEYVVAPSKSVYRLPSGIEFEEAAAIPVNFLTAWHNLFTRANITVGDYVLIVGGGSGVGYAAIQLAKLAGATVITTVGDDWKVEKAREVGADYVINRRKEDVGERVREITGGAGVDLVFEHAGTEMWKRVLETLRPGGVMVFCGATTGEVVEVNIRSLYRRQISLVGAYTWDKGTMSKILSLFERGKLKAVIDSVMKLEDAPEAHRRMEENRHFGKIILKP